MTGGLCHCGAVGWTHAGPVTDGLVCNCSICRRTGAIWAYGHFGRDLALSGVAPLPYVWGDRLLEFLRCPTCGNLVAWRGLTEVEGGGYRGAVNLRLAKDPAPLRALPLRRFDGADTWHPAAPDGRCLADLWI